MSADVAEEAFVEAGVDCLVAFLAAMLEREDCSGFFCVSQAQASNVFIADLKLCVHELDQSHEVHFTDPWFLEDLDVCDDLPSFRGEAHVKGNVLEECVNSVEA